MNPSSVPSSPEEATPTPASELEWAAITVYVRTVAFQAFARGFAVAENAETPDYAARKREAERYIASGFEVDDVKGFHPSRLPASHFGSRFPGEELPADANAIDDLIENYERACRSVCRDATAKATRERAILRNDIRQRLRSASRPLPESPK